MEPDKDKPGRPLKDEDLNALALDISNQARSLSIKGQLLASAIRGRDTEPSSRKTPLDPPPNARAHSEPTHGLFTFRTQPSAATTASAVPSVVTPEKKSDDEEDWISIPDAQRGASAPNKNVFAGSVFAFDSLNAYELRTIVEAHGGATRYGLSAECTHLVSGHIAQGSVLVNRARTQEGIAIVSEGFVQACVQAGRLLTPAEAGEQALPPVLRSPEPEVTISPIKITPYSSSFTTSSTSFLAPKSLSGALASMSISQPVALPHRVEEVKDVKKKPPKELKKKEEESEEELEPSHSGSFVPVVSSGATSGSEGDAEDQVHPGEGTTEYSLLKYDLLQSTDLETNHNKYYALEIHHFIASNTFRVFTHYGRTDDLEKNPAAGIRQSRPCPTFAEATKQYAKLLKDKTGGTKGYKPLELASSKIGSAQLKKAVRESYAKQESAIPSLAAVNPADLSKPVVSLVEHLYEEATQALTTAVAVNITNKGIETPLGILTLAQIAKGERVLSSIEALLAKSENVTKSNPALIGLSGEFYTHIPHRLGRSRVGVQDSCITTMLEVEEKRELLQLMEDMLTINASGGSHSVLKEGVGFKYVALRCNITHVPQDTSEFSRLRAFVEESQVRETGIHVKNVFALKRPTEVSAFVGDAIPNHMQLFHASRPSNFVGILSRGLLMPKKIVAQGGKLTNVGWLGAGLYFAENACTSTRYAAASSKNSRFMLINTVACGTPFHTTHIDASLTRAPPGTHSVHGISARKSPGSDFEDDEWVVYNNNQTVMSYLVEFVSDEKLRLPPPSKIGERKAEEQSIKLTGSALKVIDSATTATPAVSTGFSFGTSQATSGFSFGAPISTSAFSTSTLSTSTPFPGPTPTGSGFSGFGQATGGFGQATGGFGQATGGFGQATGGFGQATGGFGGFGQTTGGFGQTTGGFGQTTGGFGPATGGFGPTGGGFGGFGQPSGGFGQATGSFGQTGGGFNSGAGLFGSTAEVKTPAATSAFRGVITTISASAVCVGIQKSEFPPDADAANSWMKVRDDHLRQLFASNRHAQELENLYVHLIDVYHPSWASSFIYESLSSTERSIPQILKEHINPNPPIGNPTIVPLTDFNQNWNVFTQGQLKGLDWSNIFVAGGCVMACLMPPSKFADGSGFKSSDIDLFLYGLTSEQATEKVRHIYQTIASNRPATEKAPAIIRTSHAITILGQFPLRHIQIVLRLYLSPAEVLLGFDIDACTAGYNGTNVVVTPRCRRALNKQYCLADLSRRSLTYEVRLFKYSKRGFAVAVPGFRGLAAVDERLYQSTPAREQGLARLLLYGRQEETRLREKAAARGAQAEDNWEAAELEVLNSDNPDKDYDNVLIPFGPTWHQWKILEVLTKRDMAQFFKNKQHKHIFVSGLDGVIDGYSPWCKICQKDQASGVKFVHREGGKQDDMRGPIRWLEDNPGRQLMTGSFHPLPAENWDKHVYDASEVTAVSPKKGKKTFLGSPSAVPKPPKPVKSKMKAQARKKGLVKIDRVSKPKKRVISDEDEDEDEKEEDEEESDGGAKKAPKKVSAKKPGLKKSSFPTKEKAPKNASLKMPGKPGPFGFQISMTAQLRAIFSTRAIPLPGDLEQALLQWKQTPFATV